MYGPSNRAPLPDFSEASSGEQERVPLPQIERVGEHRFKGIESHSDGRGKISKIYSTFTLFIQYPVQYGKCTENLREGKENMQKLSAGNPLFRILKKNERRKVQNCETGMVYSGSDFSEFRIRPPIILNMFGNVGNIIIM